MYSAEFTDGKRFDAPCSKVVCVGRNYAEHAKELNNPIPSSPLLFIKPESSIQHSLDTVVLHRDGLHYEAELAILIGQDVCLANNGCCDNAGRALTAPASEISSVIAGLGLALDLTDRELQSKLKNKGQPWERAKAFKGACYLSRFTPYQGEDLSAVEFSLSINGHVRQKGLSADMLFSVEALIKEIACVFGLRKGDVVLTGTPEGVGTLVDGDTLQLELDSGMTVLRPPLLNVSTQKVTA